ncbi:MAG: hypothetical protein M4D80_14465 [Myxococcota bacterium]|nr:hypothetical protein [Myxococcota bacterium]
MLADAGSIDSQEPDAPPLPPNVVTVDTFGDPPLFIRYRNGAGPWLEPTLTSDRYEFHIDTHYELVAVCGDATNGYEVAFEAATYEEVSGETYLPCFSFGIDDLDTHPLTGTMVQAGRVSVGMDTDDSQTGNWTFALDAAEGTNDLLAVGGGRMLLRRDIAVAMPTTTPPINLVQDGVATTAVALTLNGLLTGETTGTQTYLFTENSFFVLADEPSATARTAPASQITPNDAQFVSVDVSGGIYRRSAFKRHTTASPASTFTLMPRLEGVQLANSTATWTSLPAGTAELSAGSGISLFRRTATEGWLAGKTSLAIDTDVPGFMPEWKLSTIDFARFEVATSQGGASYRSGIVTPPPSLTTLSRFERAHRAGMRRVSMLHGGGKRRISTRFR